MNFEYICQIYISNGNSLIKKKKKKTIQFIYLLFFIENFFNLIFDRACASCISIIVDVFYDIVIVYWNEFVIEHEDFELLSQLTFLTFLLVSFIRFSRVLIPLFEFNFWLSMRISNYHYLWHYRNFDRAYPFFFINTVEVFFEIGVVN